MSHKHHNAGSSEADKKEHEKNLYGIEAIDKLKDIAKSAENCFFCTNIKTGVPMSVRPMSVLQVDDEGNLWFMSGKDSHKKDEIEADPFTHLFFQENKNSGFLNIYGITDIVEDQAKIDELWNPLLNVWFPGGKDDLNICLLKVTPTNVYYWDTKHGELVSFAKMVTSMFVGKTMDDSVEGKLDI